jgi:glutamyl-tRNA reductase
MESLRKTRDESLRNDILAAVAKAHPKVTTARIVQSFLEKQNEKIVQATEGCREVADQERFAFDDLKRCVGSGSRRRGNEAQALSALARDRDKVIAELRDLSVEPAYVQYRKDRDPLPPSTSSEQWPRSRASREEQSPWNQRSYYGGPNSYAPRSYYGR